jgi:pilus assembly protein CpaB
MAGIAVQSGSRPRGNRLIIILAVVFGLLTAALLVAYLRRQDEQRRVLTEASVPVVVAAKDIPLGANITSAMVENKMVTPDVAVASAFSESGRIVGLRARAAIPAGAQVVPGMVVQSGAADALSFVVPPGKRAVAVTGSDVIGGGAHIRPGDFVDVMVTVEAWRLVGGTPPSGAEKPKGVFTIIQNVEVLAVSDQAEKIAESGPNAKSKEDATLKSLSQAENKSVTLAVDPQQAQLLFLADQEGKIRLALRPFGERDEQTLQPVVEPIILPGSSAAPRSR